MTKPFRTLDDVDVRAKRVLLRVDLNVPMESGRVTDATRLERVAPTITEISAKGGKVILLAHFGRPKGRDPKESLKPVAAALADVIKRPVAFADDCAGEPAQKAIAAMKDGDILCLENTRFHKEEEANDKGFDAALFNPAGYSTGYPALVAAIAQVRFPTIEIHISNPVRRGPISETARVSHGMVTGFGLPGYYLALRGVRDMLAAK